MSNVKNDEKQKLVPDSKMSAENKEMLLGLIRDVETYPKGYRGAIHCWSLKENDHTVIIPKEVLEELAKRLKRKYVQREYMNTTRSLHNKPTGYVYLILGPPLESFWVTLAYNAAKCWADFTRFVH